MVVFAAAQLVGDVPRYHLHRPLAGLACSRMFILDDKGPGDPPRPCWYLGRLPELELAGEVAELIERVAGGLGAERVITCGSSKGGWAALYFGCRVGAAHAVAGEPQMHLGRYLAIREHADILSHLAGSLSPEEAREELDRLLPDAFAGAPSPPRAHLFCGETVYLEDEVRPLIRHLDEVGVPWELERSDHREHVSDVLGKAFAPFLRGRLESLLARPG